MQKITEQQFGVKTWSDTQKLLHLDIEKKGLARHFLDGLIIGSAIVAAALHPIEFAIAVAILFIICK